MPKGALHPCNGAGCRTLVEHGERWCEACRLEHQRTDRARRGDARTDRGYDSRWRRYRLAYLKAHPLCVECAPRVVAATVVDHIKAHKGNHQLFWDPKNHRAVCKPCHDRRVDEGDFGRPITPTTVGTGTQRATSHAPARDNPAYRGVPGGTPEGEGGDPSLGRSDAPPAAPPRTRACRFRDPGGQPLEPETDPDRESRSPTGVHRG